MGVTKPVSLTFQLIIDMKLVPSTKSDIAPLGRTDALHQQRTAVMTSTYKQLSCPAIEIILELMHFLPLRCLGS